MIDLKTPGVAKAISERLMQDIDSFAETEYDDGFRWHLGGSLIGHKCDNYLWLTFRWMYKPNFKGRMQRLFQRGHREEEMFRELLEGIGCQIWTEDLTNNDIYVDTVNINFYKSLESALLEAEENNLYKLKQDDAKWIKIGKGLGFKFPQFRFTSENSHFGGSKDAIIVLPPRYQVEQPILGEMKTNGTGAGFNKLGTGGVRIAKPTHWTQICTYATDEVLPFDNFLYLNVNKNDDTMHVELGTIDKALGEKMKAKADRIIASDGPMTKVSNQKTYFECGYCAARDVCHSGAVPEKNCRSCIHAVAVVNGEWACRNMETPSVIPREFVYTGCEAWHPATVKL